MRLSALRISTLVLALVLAATAVASASHRPSPPARAAMNSAVKHSQLMPPPIRQGHFRLRAALVSSAGPWAKATIQPTGPARHQLDSVLAIFRRDGSGWRIAGLGTASAGCDHPRLPGPVRRDLHLSCP